MTPKVCILVWKDLLYRRNQIITTLLEIIIPIAFVVVLNTQLDMWNRPSIIGYRQDKFFESKINEGCDFESGHQQEPDFQYHASQIVYEPSNPFLRTLMNNVACQLGFKISSVKPGVVTIDEHIFMGIKFKDMDDNQDSVPETLKYTLYPIPEYFKHADLLWQHAEPDALLATYPYYYHEDILKVFYAVEISFLKMKNISVETKLTLKTMDVTSNFSNRYDTFIIPFLIASIYLFSNVVVTSKLVREKISGAKELLLMMGIKRWQIWLSKFIDAILPLTIIITVFLVMFYCSLAGQPLMFEHVRPVDMIIFFVFGTLSIIAFLFFLSTIFKSALTTVLVTDAFWLIILVGQKLIQAFSTSKSVNLVKLLIPHVAMLEGARLLSDFEYFEKVVKYEERLSSRPDALNLSEILLMMILDLVLYSFLTWYCEQVFPGPYGIPQSYIFFFKKSYWIPNKIENVEGNVKTEMEFVEEARGLSEGISVQNVSKTYKKYKKDGIKAVDNVSINFYENEITGLLGHNGAGKTTLISIICGFTPATSGRVLVNGYDVAKSTDEARKSLGLCPQHDLLFTDLTAIQNIAFYGMIKGLSRNKAYKDAENILKRFRMEDAKNTKAGNLSGGQKRKVSLAIALAGDSKVIVLDEPTSGLDPEIRREIWDILLPLKGSKTVILTTHFMEEADALCNRIAIMDLGKVKCFATPMLLKSKYGAGYTLTVVATDLGKVPKIMESVKGIIKTSLFKSQNALTLYFTLPEPEMPNFPALFDNLDNKKATREILTYSLNISTLEDVFLKVSHDASKKNGTDTVDASPYQRFRNTDELQANKYSTRLVIFCQILALLSKKVLFFRRRLLAFIIINVIFMGVASLESFLFKDAYSIIGVGKIASNRTIPLSLDTYHRSKVLLVSDESELAKSFETVIKDHKSEIVKVGNVTAAFYSIFYKDFMEYINLIMAPEFTGENITAFWNYEAVQAPPIIINTINNAYLAMHEAGSIEAAVSFQYIAHMYPELVHREDYTCPIARFVYLPTYMAFFFFLGPLEEKSHGAKHLQLMLTSVIIYWLTHLIFDLIIFLCVVAIVYVIYGCGNKKVFEIMRDKTGLILPSLILWSMALLLCYYAITVRFKSPATVYIFAIIFFFVALILQVMKDISDFSEYLSYLHPSIHADSNHDYICKTGEAPFTYRLAIYCGVVFLFIVLSDSKILGTLFHKCLTALSNVKYHWEYRRDTAVETEEENVENIIQGKELSSKVLVVQNLKRWFFRKCKKIGAVRGISFSVNHGECFGLLGVNGAGKTSTFSMLTGVLVPSKGKAYVNGVPLFNVCRRSEALSKIGYCPQSGGFLPSFSVKENLILFAKLRGIRCSLVRKEVRKWVEKMNLEPHRNKKCLQLSGGNQRKLSTAIALIGDSPLLFLDEPTTGVDPAGRRSIWNIISGCREEGQSVVLTSHSMDECEALCTRLTIMVKGQLCCIGETAVLKDTFGQGYSVLVKIAMNSTDDDRSRLKAEMAQQFDPGCNLTDEHLTMFQYHITNTSITWKKLFVKLSEMKKKFRFLESYSASATTLEQLFLYFARNQ